MFVGRETEERAGIERQVYAEMKPCHYKVSVDDVEKGKRWKVDPGRV